MAREAVLAAGVLSLMLVGTWRTAAANSNNDRADEAPGVVRVWGKTLCMAHAPPEASCDWRVPSQAGISAQTRAVASTFGLFGKIWCLGPGHSDGCDIRYPDVGASSRAEPRVLRPMGLNFCVTDSPPTSRCDVTFTRETPGHRERRASS